MSDETGNVLDGQPLISHFASNAYREIGGSIQLSFISLVNSTVNYILIPVDRMKQ